MERKPEAWETDAPAPFLTIEGSDVAVWALGDERFRVCRAISPGRSKASLRPGGWLASTNRLRDTGRAMSEESTTPDLVELTRDVTVVPADELGRRVRAGQVRGCEPP